jgi:hypothetical protein
MTPRQTIKDISSITAWMIGARLSDEQRYPVLRSTGRNECEISIEGSPVLSSSLKDIPYDEAYAQLVQAQAFNLKLVDGALVQMVYTFKNDIVTSHRLAFFPSPYLAPYDDAADLYEADEIFADIMAHYLVRFPIRFDFSASDSEHIEVSHPKSHVTLGQYKNCRIPVNGPVSPGKFIKFIARNFYFSAIAPDTFSKLSVDSSQIETITSLERQISHFIA